MVKSIMHTLSSVLLSTFFHSTKEHTGIIRVGKPFYYKDRGQKKKANENHPEQAEKGNKTLKKKRKKPY